MNHVSPSPDNIFPPKILERIKVGLDKYKNTHEQQEEEEEERKTIAQVLNEMNDKITPMAVRSIRTFVRHNPTYEHVVITLLHDSVNSTDIFTVRQARDLVSLIVNPHTNNHRSIKQKISGSKDTPTPDRLHLDETEYRSIIAKLLANVANGDEEAMAQLS